ncbi:hypothetical protein D9615_006046 [Tricholomella constricta]|uniref:Magnesium transport protein CorA n=1 Tax=Tricholomella constricta TaxID=117010 RepID=A0A8H5H9P5_9AGAR|nr:hypothetical protein D9615_006046 [Tricholomella constricta]
MLVGWMHEGWMHDASHNAASDACLRGLKSNDTSFVYQHNYAPAMPPPDPEQKYVWPRRTLNTSHAGAEPGTNPRRPTAAESYDFKEACVIEVADYCSDHASLRRLTNAELVNLMKEPLPKIDSGGTARASVRWINIGGLDWNVISAVGLKYNLHALALEDVLHEQGHNQSKADYYTEHLFIRILCHTLERDEDNEGHEYNSSSETPSEFPGAVLDSLLETGVPNKEKSTHMEHSTITIPTVPVNNGSHELKRRFTALSGFLAPARKRQILKIKALTKGDRINIRHEPMSIFLLRNGTVITIHPRPDLDFTAPISERLLHPESVLRTSEDASLLVEGLLDLIVDRILEIMDEYQDKIHQVEHDALLKPGLSTMRSLHILSGDLVMHKRTFDPIRTMICGLMRFDLDRCIALADNVEAEAERLASLPGRLAHDISSGGHKGQKIQGFFSFKAILYLSDVNDHMDFVLTSLDMFAGISENLINFAFNTASYEMNQVIRRLTLTTIIFLPLTLLTGYFGMNFTSFRAIDGSVSLYWAVALPSMAALIPIFMSSDLRNVYQYVKKRMAARNSVKVSPTFSALPIQMPE